MYYNQALKENLLNFGVELLNETGKRKKHCTPINPETFYPNLASMTNYLLDLGYQGIVKSREMEEALRSIVCIVHTISKAIIFNRKIRDHFIEHLIFMFI